MAKQQRGTHKRYNKSQASPEKKAAIPTVNTSSNNINIPVTNLKSHGQDITAESGNQKLVIRDIKKTGILFGIIILIIIIISIILPHLSVY